MTLLSQTAFTHELASNAPPWWFWIEVVLMPIAMLLMRQVLARLKAGDEKFEKHGNHLIELSVEMKTVAKDLDRQRESLEDAMQRMTDIFVEGRGSIAELEAKLEREFARKADVQTIEKNILEQFSRLEQAIRNLSRGGRS